MTFLELCNMLAQEGAAAGSGLTAVTGQVGEYKRIVSWIARADEDVQRLSNSWLFMRSGFTVNTVADTAAYAYGSCTDTTTSVAITAFRNWINDSFKCYLQSSGIGGEAELSFLDYDDWYRHYGTGVQNSGQPAEFTILANRSFSLGPKPNAVYVVSGEYQKAVTTMTASSDTPVYPSEYHMLAVYRAMMSFGRFTGATEVYQDGKNNYLSMLSEMERTQLPEICLP